MTDPELDRSFGFLVSDVSRLLRKRFDQRARTLGLTRAQWQVLANLARCEGINQTGLADILEIEPITLARLIDRMEEAGWVARRPHPSDRRARLLFLTDKAQPIFARMRALGDATKAEALAGVPAADRERMVEVLLHIRRNLCERPANGVALVEEPGTSEAAEPAPAESPNSEAAAPSGVLAAGVRS